MNNKTIQHIIASALLAAILLPVSCQREELQAVSPVVTPAVNVHGGEVTVGLSLDVAGEDAGTPEAREYLNAAGTKAVKDPDDTTGTATTEINDFYLLQFNGTADTCKLIGVQYFIYDEFISPSNPNGAGKVKLISSSAADAVFVIANTCDSRLVFPYGMTMSALKSKVKSIGSYADIFGKGAATGIGTSFPDDRDYHIMMNAQENATIDTTTSLSLSLRRNLARVIVKINNTTETTDPDNEVTIKTLSIRNVPTTSPYITNTTVPMPAIYPVELTQTFDYPAEPYMETGNVFYIPVNKRGTNDNTTQNRKGLLAPAYSTYLLVDAEYGTGAVKQPVSYSFYLGANLTDDYNLLPNHTYTYTITMRKKGNPEYDYRVEDWGTVDFTPSTVERANCYILNPAPTGDRQFRIPIDRIRTFWGGEAMTDSTGYEKYEVSTNPDQFMNQTFSAYILWTDIEDIADHVTIEMTNKDKSKNIEEPYFTATVKPGTEGNAVVAVQGSIGGEEILWSWHLWITDYKPDEVERYSPEDGRYIYPVRGGAMHRYAGEIWKTGIYKEKFIMDRNLGALDTTFVNASTEGKGVLYYQFGRKDPLPGQRNAALYYPKSDLADGLKWKVVGAKDDGAAFTDITAVRYSVKYPLAFIKGPSGYWTYGNKYNPTTYNSAIRWQDPNVQSDEGKSLFDPCPPGYRVPMKGTWSDFRKSTDSNPTTNIGGGDNPPRNLPPYGSIANLTMRGGKSHIGLHYYPGTDDVHNTIFYPTCDYLYSGLGTLYDGSSFGYYWSCGPGGASSGYFLYFNLNVLDPSNKASRAGGLTVRCVQE